MRAAKGEDIADELHSMLAKWLLNHIANEDRDYAKLILEEGGNELQAIQLAPLGQTRPSGIAGLLKRFFR